MSDQTPSPTSLIDDERPEAAGGTGPRPVAQTGDHPATDGRTEMGTFDEAGEYTPRQVTSDDLGGMSFEDAIAGTIVEFDDGDIVNGTVVKVDKDEVLLDIGYKSEGVIPARELSIRNDVDPHEIVSLGDEIEALVLQKEDKEGRLVLSKKRAQYERAWGTIEKIKEDDGVVRGPVIEVVKGGLILDIGLRGFLPASLVELRRVRDLQPYVGTELEAKIIELDKNRNNVVLSPPGLARGDPEGAARGVPRQPQAGRGPQGRRVARSSTSAPSSTSAAWTASSTCPSCRWKHVDHPGSVVQVGDEIEVQVLDVDLDRERISLSLKATQQDPWQEFASSHRVGELVYGRVTKLVPFGAFVQVGDGIEGLVHISEMAAHHVDLPEQVVTPGEELWVKIIDLDLQRRRISLSIKQAAEGGEVAAEYRRALRRARLRRAGQLHRPADRRQHRRRAGLGRVLRAVPRAARAGLRRRRGRGRGRGRRRRRSRPTTAEAEADGRPRGAEAAAPRREARARAVATPAGRARSHRPARPLRGSAGGPGPEVVRPIHYPASPADRSDRAPTGAAPTSAERGKL